MQKVKMLTDGIKELIVKYTKKRRESDGELAEAYREIVDDLKGMAIGIRTISGKLIGMQQLMAEQGINVLQMSKTLGISDASIYNYFTGVSSPTLETMQNVCKILNCTLQDLV